MKTVFSTNHVHARDRFDFWHGVACKNLVDHNSLPECRLTFGAHIETGYLGNLELVLFRNSPMKVSHTARHIANAKSDHVFVCRQAAGVVIQAATQSRWVYRTVSRNSALVQQFSR